MASSTGGGKRKIYNSIGGKGTKTDQGKKCGPSWNPGRSLPSKKFKK